MGKGGWGGRFDLRSIGGRHKRIRFRSMKGGCSVVSLEGDDPDLEKQITRIFDRENDQTRGVAGDRFCS